MLDDAQIFVTGGAGFIGSTLAGRLLERNRVVIYDSFVRDALSTTPWATHPNLRIVHGDVLDAQAVRAAMQGATHVVHCAAIAGIDTVTRKPVHTLRVNMLGSAHVLEAAAELDSVKRVVCFSTSEIFGSFAFRAAESDDAVVGAVGEPRWTYAVGKLAEEHLALAYHAERGLPAVVLRPFNVYGPGQVGEGALSGFVNAALRGEPLVVHGDGAQIRAWCYVDDMVDCVLRALHDERAVGQSFNVGNARAVCTIRALAETIVRLTDSRSIIEERVRAGADVALRIPATHKAEELLGFRAQVSLEEGILRTVRQRAAALAAGSSS